MYRRCENIRTSAEAKLRKTAQKTFHLTQILTWSDKGRRSLMQCHQNIMSRSREPLGKGQRVSCASLAWKSNRYDPITETAGMDWWR